MTVCGSLKMKDKDVCHNSVRSDFYYKGKLVYTNFYTNGSWVKLSNDKMYIVSLKKTIIVDSLSYYPYIK